MAIKGGGQLSKAHERELSLVNHYVDLLETWSHVEVRPLFGAIALKRSGLVFAMVWQGALYFKVNSETREEYKRAASSTLRYYRNGKMQSLSSFWEVPLSVAEDASLLQRWAERAFQAAIDANIRNQTH